MTWLTAYKDFSALYVIDLVFFYLYISFFGYQFIPN